MKDGKISWRRFMLGGVVVMLSALVFTACKKDNGTPVRIPAAGLLVFNLAPDQDAIGVALSGRLINNAPLQYTNYNGIYQSIYTGARDIDVYNFASDSSLAKSNFDFQDSTSYSLFVVGNKGVYKSITVKDDVDTASAGNKAFIRYINAIPDSSAPLVTISSGSTKVSDASAPFATVSGFQAVDSGNVTVTIGNNSTIAATRTLPLEKGKAYTVLLIGDPAASNGSRRVEIRYIVNGTVTTDSGN